jgi:hypothetical protein
VAVSSINEHTGLDIESPADDSGVEPAMQSDDAVMGVAEPVVASYGSFTDPVAPLEESVTLPETNTNFEPVKEPFVSLSGSSAVQIIMSQE